MKYLLLLSLLSIGCSSFTTPERDDAYYACINAYTHVQMRYTTQGTFGEANRWCESQSRLLKTQKNRH